MSKHPYVEGKEYYILDDNDVPIPAESYRQWIEWKYDTTETRRRVAQDTLTIFSGDVCVSTIFLGDSYFWEMLIRGGKYDLCVAHFLTKELAIEGHRNALLMVLVT